MHHVHGENKKANLPFDWQLHQEIIAPSAFGPPAAMTKWQGLGLKSRLSPLSPNIHEAPFSMYFMAVQSYQSKCNYGRNSPQAPSSADLADHSGGYSAILAILHLTESDRNILYVLLYTGFLLKGKLTRPSAGVNRKTCSFPTGFH